MLAKLHGRESGWVDMGVRRVARTRLGSCGDFFCKVRGKLTQEIGVNFRR